MASHQNQEKDLISLQKKQGKEKEQNYSRISTEETSLELMDMKIEKEDIITITDNCTNNELQLQSPIAIEKSQHFFYKKLGNTFAFLGDKEGNPRIIVGPHWPMYFCFNGLVTGGYMLFFWRFWSFLHPLFKVFGVLIYSTFSLAYTIAFLINPGYPRHDLKSKTGEPRNLYLFCSECQIWVSKDKDTIHCADCNICIEGLDHHCPWISKCVGRRNIYPFYAFTISICFLIIYIVLALSAVSSNNKAMKG